MSLQSRRPPSPPTRRAAIAIAIAIALLGGCSHHDEAPRSAFPGPPAVILGTGVFDYVSLTDGTSAQIVHGPQGGYHIWCSLRVRYMRPDQADVRLTLSSADTGKILNVVQTVIDLHPILGDAGVPPEGPEWMQSLGSLLFVPDPAVIDGKAIHIQAVVTDREGRVATDEKTVIAHR